MSPPRTEWWCERSLSQDVVATSRGRSLNMGLPCGLNRVKPAQAGREAAQFGAQAGHVLGPQRQQAEQVALQGSDLAFQGSAAGRQADLDLALVVPAAPALQQAGPLHALEHGRSEERRVGKECGSVWSSLP